MEGVPAEGRTEYGEKALQWYNSGTTFQSHLFTAKQKTRVTS
jgi:hypothetical protein